MVRNVKDGFGFIQCVERDDLYFSFRDVDASVTTALKTGDEVVWTQLRFMHI